LFFFACIHGSFAETPSSSNDENVLRSHSGLESTAWGRDWLKYIVRCALPAGSSIDVAHDGTSDRLDGAFGLAPQWKHAALDDAGKRWVSACVLGFVNVLGVHVLISMRGDNANLRATVSETERRDFAFQEAAFYGDIFADPPTTFVCRGRGGPRTSPVRDKRLCSDPSERAGISRCEMIIAGDCSAVCTEEDPRDHAYRGCRGGDRVFDEVVTVFLPMATE
jgi:hypothetical protein